MPRRHNQGVVVVREGPRRHNSASAVAVVHTTWNPLDKNARFTLTNASLTATIDASGTYSILRATSSKSAGKWYFEGTIVAVGGFVGIGLADANQLITDSHFLGDSAHSVCYHSTGIIDYAAGGTGSLATSTTGDVVGIAVDLGARLLWASKNGAWLNGDPATATGGQTIASLDTNVFPAGDGQSSASFTANFGATAFAHAAPTGFAGWGS